MAAKRGPMDQRAYHGEITPEDLAEALIADFNQGNLRAQQVGHGEDLVVQITTSERHASGGDMAIAVQLSQIEDGVLVRIGEQAWLGIAASLGQTTLMALRNPWSLLGRLDDIAQDLVSLQLKDKIWETLERAAGTRGASLAISDRLRRLECGYCGTANPVGAPHCIACGAPLGAFQPIACTNCGFVVDRDATECPQCGNPIER